jgi:hypothetical protein
VKFLRYFFIVLVCLTFKPYVGAYFSGASYANAASPASAAAAAPSVPPVQPLPLISSPGSKPALILNQKKGPLPAPPLPAATKQTVPPKLPAQKVLPLAKIEPLYGSLSLPKLPAGQMNEIIRDLSFVNPSKVVIEHEVTAGSKPKWTAKIIGKFSRASGRVLSSPDLPTALVWMVPETSNEFTLTVPVPAERSLIRFRAVDSAGKIENQTVVLSYKKQAHGARHPQWAGLRPTVSLGVMMFNFNESYRVSTLAFNTSEILSTVKVSYNLHRKNLDLGLSAFYTPIVLSNNYPKSESKLLRFDLQIGYTLPKVASPWRLSFSAGILYTTMMVPTNYFGYKNAVGPQLTATLQKIMSSNDTLHSYFKITPFPIGAFGFSLANREYVLGIGWLRPLGNQHPLSFNFEIMDFLAVLDIVYGTTSDTHNVHGTSFGLSASYGF